MNRISVFSIMGCILFFAGCNMLDPQQVLGPEEITSAQVLYYSKDLAVINPNGTSGNSYEIREIMPNGSYNPSIGYLPYGSGNFPSPNMKSTTLDGYYIYTVEQNAGNLYYSKGFLQNQTTGQPPNLIYKFSYQWQVNSAYYSTGTNPDIGVCGGTVVEVHSGAAPSYWYYRSGIVQNGAITWYTGDLALPTFFVGPTDLSPQTPLRIYNNNGACVVACIAGELISGSSYLVTATGNWRSGAITWSPWKKQYKVYNSNSYKGNMDLDGTNINGGGGNSNIAVLYGGQSGSSILTATLSPATNSLTSIVQTNVNLVKVYSISVQKTSSWPKKILFSGNSTGPFTTVPPILSDYTISYSWPSSMEQIKDLNQWAKGKTLLAY